MQTFLEHCSGVSFFFHETYVHQKRVVEIDTEGEFFIMLQI
jgi:hypothetical protein